jgi:DNA-binding NarL/FixJ family response regulator
MRILLADDHDLFREGFALVIQTLFPQIKVIEQVQSWETLRVAAHQQYWDLIILDPCMSTEQRWDFELERLCAIHANTKKILNICVVTSSTSARDMQLSFQLGVRGYFSKISDLEEVKMALQKVLAGQVYMPSSVWGISDKNNGQILVTELGI